MVETTVLVVPGKKLSVPRILKRSLQIAFAVVLTAAVFLVMIVGNGMVVGRNASLQTGMNAWLAFIQRPDILATIWVTALVTVLVIYWMRDRERKTGGSSRMLSWPVATGRQRRQNRPPHPGGATRRVRCVENTHG